MFKFHNCGRFTYRGKLAAETDMTMLLVTHEMGFAHDFADRVLFFADGRISRIQKNETRREAAALVW